jgi:hypothetical protein
MLNDGNKSETICRICGYDDGSIRWELENDKLYPSYFICECCESEAGYYDCIISAIRSKRESWFNNGAQWRYPKSKPADWDLEKQLAKIPEEYK